MGIPINSITMGVGVVLTHAPTGLVLLAPYALDTESMIEKLPTSVIVVEGCCDVLKLSIVPLLADIIVHPHEVGAFALVSVNWTATGIAPPVVFWVKDAEGAETNGTVMNPDRVGSPPLS